MSDLRLGSLFSGRGGFEIGANLDNYELYV